MRLKTLVAVFGFLTLLACSDTKTTSAPKMTNSELETQIKARLEADPDLRAANLSVDADAKEGEVKLSGTVSSEALRTRAVQTVQSYRSDLRLVDKVDVKPPEITRADYTEQMATETRVKAKSTGAKIGSSLDDAWIHTKLTTKLAADSPGSAFKINVDVVNNAVTLRGTVKNVEAKADAERIAKNTDGVKKVTNLLVVKSD